MFLLPPSPKPFGVFAEKSEVPLAQWEVDMLVALEVERQILASYWERLVEHVAGSLRAGCESFVTSTYPLEYIYLELEVEDG